MSVNIYDVLETPEKCPECATGVLEGQKENYGADADGRRGRTFYYGKCNKCGYETNGRF